jgi:CBS domain containing-hemolysin-like protein
MQYSVLQHRVLESDIGYHRPNRFIPPRVSLNSPALEVMTDLKQISATTVSPNESIDQALDLMKQRGVRMLLVVDIADAIVGIVTAADINGERPIQFIQQNEVERKDIRVRDIMTPHKDIEVLLIQEVSTARVGDIVETLKQTARQHALVADFQGIGNRKTIRGIISLTQIARQLGVQLQNYEVAHTLAEIAHVIHK